MTDGPSQTKTYHVQGQPSSRTIVENALAYLRPHLPVSLPVFRRLQFGRFFSTTVLITNLPLDQDRSQRIQLDHTEAPETDVRAPYSDPSSSSDSHPPNTAVDDAAAREQPWLIAFADRSTRPETEVYLFGSWESVPSIPIDAHVEDLFRSAVRAMADLGLPPSIHGETPLANGDTSQERDSVGLTAADYSSHAMNPTIMLWGAVHERSAQVIDRLGLRSDMDRMWPNLTFVWDVEHICSTRELPQGLRWGEVRHSHIALVRSRTKIPRMERTLRGLPSVAIFPDDDGGNDEEIAPIGWVFIGLDGSLTSLHVEPEWRRRGLAKAMTVRIFTTKMGMFWDESLPHWAHGYVIVGNKESEGMCRNLGGQSDFESYWIRVDLGKL